MKEPELLDHFELFIQLPEAVPRLRHFILDLAVRGKLVESRDDAEPLAELLLRAASGDGANRGTRRRARRRPAGDAFDTNLTWEVPATWTFVTLETLAGGTGFFTDGDWVESKDQDPTGDVRLTQLADVGVGEWRDRSARSMRMETAQRLNCTFLAPGDVLIARMPDPLGRACIFPGDPRPCVTAVDVAILRIDDAYFDRAFIVHAINSPVFAANAESKAAGTTRSRVSRGNLSVLPFPVPPIAEQRELAARVSELFDLCTRLEAAKEGARQLRRQLMEAVLHEALGDGAQIATASHADPAGV